MIRPPDSAHCDDAIGDSDAVDLSHRIASGSVSALEVIEAAIARATAVNPELNAIAVTAYDQAREQVREQAKTPGTGKLEGVPTFIKDNNDWRGLPTR